MDALKESLQGLGIWVELFLIKNDVENIFLSYFKPSPLLFVS